MALLLYLRDSTVRSVEHATLAHQADRGRPFTRSVRTIRRGICIAGLALALERGVPSRAMQDLNALLSDLRHAVTHCVDYLRDTVN